MSYDMYQFTVGSTIAALRCYAAHMTVRSFVVDYRDSSTPSAAQYTSTISTTPRVIGYPPGIAAAARRSSSCSLQHDQSSSSTGAVGVMTGQGGSMFCTDSTVQQRLYLSYHNEKGIFSSSGRRVHFVPDRRVKTTTSTHRMRMHRLGRVKP